MSAAGSNTKLNSEERPKNFGRPRKTELPSVEILRQIFEYDALTGVLTWKRRYGSEPGVAIFNGGHAGMPAGSPHQGGYLQVSFTWEGVKHHALVHRVCFALHNGYLPETVDHEHNNRKDNRACELRDAGSNGNQCNRSVTDAKSGLKGVYTHVCTGKFFSQIRAKGKYHYLGIFDTEIETALAYDAAAIRLHGAFAKTNAALNLIGDAA